MIKLYCYEYVFKRKKSTCIESLHDMAFVERSFSELIQEVCRDMKSLACEENVIVEV